jgi:predicted enzyme related to lactoylglutathione lyase
MPNEICHFAIGGKDLPGLRDFYSKIFDWNFQEMGGDIQIKTGGDVGGHFDSDMPMGNYVTFYVKVDDLQKSYADAVSAGGKSIVPPKSLGFGSYAWIADPEGNVVGLYQNSPE